MIKLKQLIVSVFISLFLFSCTYPVYESRPYIINKDKKVVSVEKKAVSGPQIEIEGAITPDADFSAIGEAPVKELADKAVEPAEENGKENNDQEKMDQAISILNQSQTLWEKGDLESALELLDDAYSLILEADGEPDISWQKDDIRVMIAKRIIEIYTSRSAVATGYQSEIPFTMNDDVKKQIRLFQRGDRSHLISSYRRSGKYRPMIVEQLREAGIPEELSWLPIVESGFKINALSRARALGLWQFIPSTGYKFGLKRDHYVDERMNAEKSTAAAVAYLKELHGIFGDWLTVLAAYNCGEGRVLRTISRQHMNYLDNFWDLYRQLPYETASYVPRYLATVHILKDPEKYGIDLGDGLEKPIPFETVTTKKCMRLDTIAKYLKVSKNTLYSLNPELRYKTTPDRDYELKIPEGTGEAFAQIVDKVPKAARPGGPVYVRHKVKQGEALSVIARKYKTSVKAIVAANRLSSKHKIRAGKWLKIPTRSYKYTAPKKYGSAKPVLKKGETITYRVKKGDSLWLLARRYGTTVSKIKRISGLKSNSLKIGQVLKIGEEAATTTVAKKKAAPSGSKKYTVRKGDSPYVIARKNNVRLADLLKMNNLTRKSRIYPGQKLILK
ncbi:MAG: LysM peptidoglycan-binding domain-containing protein [Deltaproteobacteria bacterium]|nr:LysM peptidoglycan-binding domain-containing protein [Deltaproteobacteria bacterium]